MITIRTVLVDDERVGRSRLRRMLEKEPDIQILTECGDGAAAVEALSAQETDLLLLDINMPGMDGFDVLNALSPDRQPKAVIFVTAHDEHAVRAFEACALDYLLKPASPERLARALTRARERILAAGRDPSFNGEDPPVRQSSNEISPGAAAAPSPAYRFPVRSGGRMSFIAPEEIDWIEAAGNYAILHVGRKNHMIRETMSGMERQLSAEAFLRINRSAIVNLRRVEELHSSPEGDYSAVLGDGQRIRITRPLREVADRLAIL